MTAFVDRAMMSVSGTPGTGSVTVGAAVPSYQTFVAAGLGDGSAISYTITDGNSFEIGHGTCHVTSGVMTVSRDTVIASSNSGAKINASSSAIIFATLLAEDLAGLGGGGGAGALTPSLVQCATSINNSGTITFNQNPTIGNLMVVACSRWSSTLTPGYGWLLVNAITSAADVVTLLVKVADANDAASPTINPFGNTNGATLAAFEIADAQPYTPMSYLLVPLQHATSLTLQVAAGVNDLVVGMVSETSGSQGITISGATSQTSLTSSNANNAVPRLVQPFSKTVASKGVQTITGTVANASDLYGVAVTIKGAAT